MISERGPVKQLLGDDEFEHSHKESTLRYRNVRWIAVAIVEPYRSALD